MRFICPWLKFTILALFFPLLAGAKIKSLTPAAILVSGTLKPLTIAINGQKILSQDADVEFISINGQELRSEKNDPHQSFFFRTSEDRLDIRNPKKESLVDIQMPRLVSLESEKNVFTATISAPTLVVKLDDQVLAGGDVSRQIFSSTEATDASATPDPWFQEEHTLALMDPATKVERLYVFEPAYDIPARNIQRIGLEIGDPGISSPTVGLGLNVFYDYIFKSHVVLGGRLCLAWPNSGFYEPRDGYLAQVRMGYQIFRKSNELHSPVWLEAGAGFEYVSYSEYKFLGEEKLSYQVPFFYVYTQPLVVGAYQFGLALQGGPRAAQSVPNFLTALFVAREW